MNRLRTMAALGAAMILVCLVAGPASAQTITNPATSPFPVQPIPANQVPSEPYANALGSFQVDVTGFPANTALFAEECDGEPSSTPQWSPTLNCDLQTATGGVRTNSSGAASFPIGDSNFGFFPFYGTGPSGLFQCVENGNTSATNPPPVWGTTPSTDCQLRVSTNNSNGGVPQAFLSLQTPNPTAAIPETHYDILLPFGALLLLGGGYVIARKRRRPAINAVS